MFLLLEVADHVAVRLIKLDALPALQIRSVIAAELLQSTLLSLWPTVIASHVRRVLSTWLAG